MATSPAWKIVPATVVALALGLGWWRLSAPPPAAVAPPPAPPAEETPPAPPPPPPAEAAPPEAEPLPPVAESPPAPPPADESWPARAGGEVAFARIQTALNQAAAQPPRPSAANDDPLAQVAEALRRIQAGDAPGAQQALDAVDSAIARRLPSEKRMEANPALADRQEWLVSYLELLPPAPRPGNDALTAAFVRLAITLRRVDALLLADMLPRLAGYDLVSRRGPGGRFDGRFLRLPCRLAASDRPRLQAAARALGQLAGPLTDCPVAPARAADFAALESLARDPAGFLARQPGPKPSAPDTLATSLIRAAATAPFPVIEAALQSGGDPARADARGLTALHYLAANPTLSPTERAQAIKLLF